MCGIAGVARGSGSDVSIETLTRMAAAIRHRGPDGYGFYRGARVGLAHVRLSVIDIDGGAQPMANEDGSLLIVYNGEVYNYLELRAELQVRGHVFRTSTDTEVLLHAYEEWGSEMLGRLNGQFAFALYDRRSESVFVARDRFGVRPLFYSQAHGDLWFASEIKALFAGGEVTPEMDPQGLDDVFTFWSAIPPRTVFGGVHSLEPGTFGVWHDGRFRTERYYRLIYPETAQEPRTALAGLDEFLRSAVTLRLRSDVPVGGYLSGGLDSSITCSLAAPLAPAPLRTFSVAFEDPALDESAFQRLVARDLGAEHRVIHIGSAEIGRAFPAVVRHAETPLVRTAPAPLYLLAELTRGSGIKVVLTGEGADELFLGYDLFKETAVRQFCLRRPASTRRQLLFDRLYPYLSGGQRGGEFWRRFFLDAGSVDHPLFSHLPRFGLTARIKEFYSAEFRERLAGRDALADLLSALPAEFSCWTPMNRAAYLEMVTLLSPYLLSSQGDRMAMAHGVEGRFPFLDHRLFEFAAALPTRAKLRTLREKAILRRWAVGVVPPRIATRPKQPYRAPDAPAFFGDGAPPYVRDLLAPESIRASGVFDPAACAALVERCAAGRATGFRENQALVAILSTQLWHREFLENRTAPPALSPEGADVLLGETSAALA